MTQTIINVPAAGAFDPTDIELTDNTSGALLIKEGSNEYMRIDTTNGSEKTIFKTQSGGSTGFFVNIPSVGDAFFVQRTGSSPASKIVSNAGTTLFQVDSSTILADLISSNKTFKVDGTPGTTPLTIDGDGETTFTLDTANNAVFKVQDNLASPTQFLTIDSNTSSESIKLALTPQNADRYLEITNSKIHARQQNSQINMGTQGITFTAYDDYLFGQFGAGKKLLFKDSSSAEERFSVDKESNATFTLDGASAATFKVVDSNATPKTYLSITESTQSLGADPYVHKVTMGDNNGYFNLGPNVLRANAMSGGSTALYGPASYMYSQSQITITTNQTYGDFDPCQTPYTMTMGAGATGNVTVDSGFTVRGDYQAGSTPKQSYPVLWVFQNDNATHNFILSFDGGATGLEHTKSGDTDAAALISAGGLTLTPGQRYIVRFQKITNELLLIESVDKH